MKLYDFDGMFDEKLSEYVKKNPQKYTESEWEELIPKLYKSFGDTYIKSVGDTPNGFFAKLTEKKLISALNSYIKNGVTVCGFLTEEIEKRGAFELLSPLLDGDGKQIEFALNVIGGDDRAIKRYMQLLVSPESGEELKEKCLDLIKEKADIAVEEAVENYGRGIERDYMLEIMSRSVAPSDKVFEILISEFRGDPENLAVNAARLAQYGDERALEYLLDKIDEEGISYIDYKELLLAIESLGGTYEKRRDFTDDPYYELINSRSSASPDIFGEVNKK